MGFRPDVTTAHVRKKGTSSCGLVEEFQQILMRSHSVRESVFCFFTRTPVSKDSLKISSNRYLKLKDLLKPMNLLPPIIARWIPMQKVRLLTKTHRQG
ncbi:hypothetical protein AVEN_57060-1 [Araneus ventricosus]|uniref:Uncharacterized protein n=1 Tax=Araneus ventricosus TaxID=182803 RepID=A0A4Y2WUQ6_ARAVE|nr:hypothetical protein AVEN_57060-1 [Araneus ventricosus]